MCICFDFIITTATTIIGHFLQVEEFGFDYCASTQ